MRNKLLLSFTLSVIAHVAIAQPSLKKMQLNLSADKNNKQVVFVSDEVNNSLAAVQFSNPSLQNNNVISWLSAQLGFRNNEDALLQKSISEKNINNVDITKLQQYYKGIKVEHGVIKFTSKTSLVNSIQLEFYTIPSDININAAITEAQAFEKATTYVGAEKYVWQGYTGNDIEFKKPVGELVFVQDIFNKVGEVCLAYKFMIYAEQPLSKQYVYVNAQNGEVVFSDRIIKHVNSPGTAATSYSGTQAITTDFNLDKYSLRETRNGHNIITVNYLKKIRSTANDAAAVDFTDANNSWTAAEFDNANWDNVALDAHWGIEKVSDYWKLIHGRNSWDNSFGEMKSYVHVRNSTTADYDNAYWSGSAMYYGDGTYNSGNAGGFKPLTSLDVTGHELGHAICQSTAGLVYQRESGGMNEGFSDIWGACMDNYANSLGTLTTLKLPFKIGDEITPGAGALRDMQTPNSFGDPDTYKGTYWSATSLGGCPYTSSNINDNCGVHTNSGVLNKWFYVVTIGESGTNDIGNTYGVTGLGFVKSQQITYLAEQNLTPNSTYDMMRTASINAATTLYGACSNEVTQVTNAWFAVGVGQSANCLPRVEFVNAALSTSESDGALNCSTKIVNIAVKLGAAATANTTVNFTYGGTATNGVDYTAPTSLSFATGVSGSQNLAISLLNDAAVEGSETITIAYTVNANGGNALAGSNNQNFVLTITNDDITPTSIKATPNTTTFLVNENFDAVATTLPTGWSSSTFFNGYSSTTNNWAVGANGGTGITGNAAYITNNTTTKPLTYTNSATTDRLLRTPLFSTVGLTNLKLSFKYKIQGEFDATDPKNVWDGGRLMYYNGTTNVLVTNPATGDPYIFYGTGDNVISLNIPLPAGMQNLASAAIGFRWFNDANTVGTPPFLIDEVLITGTPTTAAVETQASQTGNVNLISGSQNSFIYSNTDSQLIAKIINLSTGVGCVTASLSAAGNTQRNITTNTGTYKGTQKVIQLSPVTPNTTATYTGTLYFTQDELAVWGAAVSNLKILKVKDGVSLTSTLNATNSQIITPTIVNNLATTGVAEFTGSFTGGFSQFLLVENATVLPVTLTNLKAELKNNDALLSWQTQQEINNKGFEIQRSFDGITFTAIGFANGSGNSATVKNYSFNDVSIRAGVTIYYRLKQVDNDGNSRLTNTVTVKLDKKGVTTAFIYPNPAHGNINITFIKPVSAATTISIVNSKGQVLLTQIAARGSVTVPLNTSALAAGAYFVKMITAESTEQLQFIKQ